MLCWKYFTGNVFFKSKTINTQLHGGEVGKLPPQVTIDKRLMSFLLRLLNKDESSLANIVYMIAHNLFVRNIYIDGEIPKASNSKFKQKHFLYRNQYLIPRYTMC